ncbi:hypothetical protein QQ73_04840, partial [Candidatus Endoriftia persephone str. Guaymas]|nr:hypothetical protein [Candidatus Endoriftia persephone str. Guaymas]
MQVNLKEFGMSAMQKIILEKKAALAESVGIPLSALAALCAEVWPDADAIDTTLQRHLKDLTH